MSNQTTTLPRCRVDRQKVFSNACGGIKKPYYEWDPGAELEYLGNDIRELVIESKRIAFQLGRLYRAAYQLCSVGKFKSWVKELGLHQPSQAYMSVFKVCFGREAVTRFIPNTILVKMCAGTFPKDLREQILSCGLAKNGDERTKVTVRDIAEAGAKIVSGEWSLYSPEVRHLIRRDDEEQTKQAARVLLREAEKCLDKTIDGLKRLQRDDYDSAVLEEISKRIEQFGAVSGSLGRMLGKIMWRE